MPYGHIKQYKELVAEAQNKRLQITRRQQQQIAKLYRDIAKDMGKEIAKRNEKTLTYRWLKDYAKSLKNQSKILFSDIQGIVSLGILDTAAAFVEAEESFWGGIVPSLSERFRDAFSSIPQTCVDELMNGGIYKDFTGLSERIWAYQKKYNRDIGYIIDRGIIEQKSAYELAKDLEMYVDPRAKKPWEWRKVYPGCNQVVDYNAQRLARTSVTHAYQMSFQRATVDNPFIERYQWHSSNAGKVCELCAHRDGKLFEKEKVPFDHPNGMCVITAVIPKSMDEIAAELNDWANGENNQELDKWLGLSKKQSEKMLMKITIPDDVYKKSGMTKAIRDKINQAIKKLEREYTIYLDGIEGGSMGRGDVFGSGGYIDTDGVLKFELLFNYDIDYQKVEQRMKLLYNKGKMAGKTFEDYIAHEIAHILPFQNCITKEDYKQTREELRKAFVSGISGYADRTQDGAESLAEAFVKYRNGEKIPDEAKRLIKKYIYPWRK